MRSRVIAALGVLVLASGCAAGETAAPATTPATTTTSTTAPTTTSPRPTAVTPDPAIAAEAAALLASRDAEAFNARICPGSSYLEPVKAIPADYAGTQAAGIDTYDLLSNSDGVTARLTVRPGQVLMLVLGLDFDTYEWCAYSVQWCPLGFTGLPPFAYEEENEGEAVLRELDQRRMCGP